MISKILRRRGPAPALVTTVAVAVALSSAACSTPASSGTASPAASPSVTFNPASVIISTEKGPVLVKAEVADTPQRRALGLSGRPSVPFDAGMVFLFFKASRESFWMKNTQVPLSIAFFGADGKILDIKDMDPCHRDPCAVYNPGVAYRGALEVNQGSLQKWDVHVGDKLTVAP